MDITFGLVFLPKIKWGTNHKIFLKKFFLLVPNQVSFLFNEMFFVPYLENKSFQNVLLLILMLQKAAFLLHIFQTPPNTFFFCFFPLREYICDSVSMRT